MTKEKYSYSVVYSSGPGSLSPANVFVISSIGVCPLESWNNLNAGCIPDGLDEPNSDPVHIDHSHLPFGSITVRDGDPPDHESKQEAEPAVLSWDTELGDLDSIVFGSRNEPSGIGAGAGG